MGLKVLSEDPEPDRPQRRPPLLAARFLPRAHDRRRRRRRRRAGAFPGPVPRHLDRPAGERRLQPAGARGRTRARARSSPCAPIADTCSRSARRSAKPMSSRPWAPIRDSRAISPQLFDARFDPARGDHSAELQVAIEARILDELEPGRQPRSGPHPAPLPGADQGHPAHQRLAAGRGGQAQGLRLLQVRPGTDPGAARAAAGVRDLRLRALCRGRASAGGRVARGGLRWSDRREDFRTEVLGLMKAQMVKNAVIVPVGAKGGFVLKRPPARRRPGRAHGRGRSLLQDLPARPARPHRRSGSVRAWSRRATSSATTATTPTSWSRPTRARPPSPTTPTASAASMASGSTTHSLRAALRATTTKGWASPPRVPGSPSSGTSASWGSTPRPSPSP